MNGCRIEAREIYTGRKIYRMGTARKYAAFLRETFLTYKSHLARTQASVMSRGGLNYGVVGLWIEEVHLAHVEDHVDIRVYLRPVMSAHPGNERVLSGIQIQVDLGPCGLD